MMKDIIRVDNLTKEFKKKDKTIIALDAVSFTLREGEILSVVGPSGSGKSTLIRCISLLYENTSGNVFFNGTNIKTLKGKDLLKMRKDLSIIFQDPYSALDNKFSAIELIKEPLAFYNKKGLLDKKHTKKEIEDEALSAFRRVSLKESDKNKNIRSFSGGEMQRIGIARAIVTRPKVLLCDEITSSLDMENRASILSLIRNINKEMNTSILFVSHDIKSVKSISDRILVLKNGKAIEIGDAEKIINRPENEITKRLLEE